MNIHVTACVQSVHHQQAHMFSDGSVRHISDLHSKFALGTHHV